MKETMKKALGEHCRTELFALNFKFLDYAVQDLEKTRRQIERNMAPSEEYTFHDKRGFMFPCTYGEVNWMDQFKPLNLFNSRKY